MKNDRTGIGYWLVLSNLKIAELHFMVTVDNQMSCHVALGDFKRWIQGEKCFLTYQFSIFSEKTKVTYYARLYRAMTPLAPLPKKWGSRGKRTTRRNKSNNVLSRSTIKSKHLGCNTRNRLQWKMVNFNDV